MGKLDRKIVINPFDPESIDRALKEVVKIRLATGEVLEDVTRRCANYLIDQAQTNLSGTRGSGELANSIIYYPSEKGGKVIVNADYGMFVEFGTGLVGLQNSNATIPKHGYKYNVGTKISDDGEWIYFNKTRGKFYKTLGQQGKYFFYNAADRTLQQVGEFWIDD